MKKIICPVCKAEYTVQEIYLPEHLLGTVREVEKDDDGKIVVFYGRDMDLRESYKCDYCNCTFNVYANIDFKTKSKTSDFNTTHTTKLERKPKMRLDEE